MNNRIKYFIEDNIELIENDEWEEVYKKAVCDLGFQTGSFTEIMLTADIHPEYYMKELPAYFLYASGIKEFIIPNSIKRIGYDAFHGCHSLTSVTIGNSVTEINSHAFYDCDSLASITLGNGITSIGSSAFYICSGLTSIVISDSVKSIGDWAFAGCSDLASIIIPDSVTSIGYEAFNYCGDKLVIEYQGSKEDWKKIYNPKDFQNTYFTVNCTDGKIVKKKR